jgi:hypothetical protein
MIVYVGAGSGPFRNLVIAAGHGQMVSPQPGAFRVPVHGRWAFDNGAYTDWLHGDPFDNTRYLARLEHISLLPDERLPDWCVVPDIVADPTSLSYSLRWRQALYKADRRLRWYLAIQDFMTPDDVSAALCLEPFDGLFIGGSTQWKWETAEKWVAWGHEQGLPVHLGRVNGPGPLQKAVDMGADSIDGTGWVRAGMQWYPHLKDVPLPSTSLFERGTPEIPEHWLKFGRYLESIWGERDWKRWAKEEQASLENAEALRAMSPDEFLSWLDAEYVSKAPTSGPEDWRGMAARNYIEQARKTPSFSGPEEIELWKRWVLWEVERILVLPVPPAPELPRYGIVNGQALPLPEALKQTKGSIEKCANTGAEMIVVKGPSGGIHVSYPVVRANSPEEAIAQAGLP